MLEDLLSAFIFEKLDKQVVRRIPYFLFLSLVIYYFATFSSNILASFALASFIVFLIANLAFDRRISGLAHNLFANLDFKKLLSSVSDIFEGDSSLLKDIKLSRTTIGAAVISGIAFSSLLTSSFVLILISLKIPKELALPAAIVVGIYLTQDIAKSSIVEEPKEDSKTPLLYGLVNKYVIENSRRHSSLSDKYWRILLQIMSVFICPLVNLKLPKLGYENMIIYKDPEHKVEHLIKGLCDEEKSLKLKHEDGESLDNFFTKGKCDSIKDLTGKSPVQCLPYLFDPNYERSDQENRKWIELSIVGKNPHGEESVGQMYIHLFRGASLKHKIGTDLYRIDPSGKEILFFVLIGEKEYVQYIKTRIETISVKYPLETFARFGQID